MTSQRFRFSRRVAMIAAVAAAVSPAVGVLTAEKLGGPVERTHPFEITQEDLSWVAEFQRFAAYGREQQASGLDGDARAGDVADVADLSEAIAAAPVITPNMSTTNPAVAATEPDPNAPIVTGSIKPARLPMLPPVPDADAYHVGKGDRLVPPHADANPIAPTASDTTVGTPHAELGPVGPEGNALAHRSRLAAAAPLLAVASRKSTATARLPAAAPRQPSGDLDPQTAADPTIPLGYVNPPDASEAPFNSLFNGPADTQSRSALAAPPMPTARPKTPRAASVVAKSHRATRVARLNRHRTPRWYYRTY